MPQVSALYDANAAPRLIAICILPSLADSAAVMDRVGALEGIREAESEIALQTIKYNAAIAPIGTVGDIEAWHAHED